MTFFKELPESILPSKMLETGKLPIGGLGSEEFTNSIVQVLKEMDVSHRKVLTFYMKLLLDVITMHNSNSREITEAVFLSESFVEMLVYMIDAYSYFLNIAESDSHI